MRAVMKVRYSEFSDTFYNAMVDEAIRCRDIGEFSAACTVYSVDAAYCCMPI